MTARLGPAAVLAAVNLGILAVGYGIACSTNPRAFAREWVPFVVFGVPTLWLAVAGWVGRGTPRRWVVGAAGVVCLALNLTLLLRVVGFSGVLGQQYEFVPVWVLASTLGTTAVAGAVAVVAAAVGWWQRRGDRPGDT